MSNYSVFNYDPDNNDIVILADSEGAPECTGWVNVGDHTVSIALQADGSLKIETYAKTAEAVLLGALTVPHAVVMKTLRDDLARTTIGHPLAPLVGELVQLGFGTGNAIDGAACVDIVNSHFNNLRISAS